MPKFKLKDIQPNRFRHLNRFPLDPEEVENCIESIKGTAAKDGTDGLWEPFKGIIRDDGLPELSFGHHRHGAMLSIYGPEHLAEFEDKKWDDEAMLSGMIRENVRGRRPSAIDRLDVYAAVIAYAEGHITLPRPDDRVNLSTLRWAPSFILGAHAGDLGHEHGLRGAGSRRRTSALEREAREAEGEKPYTAETLSTAIAWSHQTKTSTDQISRRLPYTLTALALIEEKILTEQDLRTLGSKEQETVVKNASRVRKAVEADAKDRAAAAAEAEKDAEKAAKAKAEEKLKAEKNKAKRVRLEKEEILRLSQQHREAEATRKKQEKEAAAEAAAAAAEVAKGIAHGLQEGEATYRAASSTADDILDKQRVEVKEKLRGSDVGDAKEKRRRAAMLREADRIAHQAHERREAARAEEVEREAQRFGSPEARKATALLQQAISTYPSSESKTFADKALAVAAKHKLLPQLMTRQQYNSESR